MVTPTEIGVSFPDGVCKQKLPGREVINGSSGLRRPLRKEERLKEPPNTKIRNPGTLPPETRDLLAQGPRLQTFWIVDRNDNNGSVVRSGGLHGEWCKRRSTHTTQDSTPPDCHCHQSNDKQDLTYWRTNPWELPIHGVWKDLPSPRLRTLGHVRSHGDGSSWTSSTSSSSWVLTPQK